MIEVSNIYGYSVYPKDGYRGGWEGLRATRWEPPGAAAETSERRRTYVFALEQAEQMFHAAASVGPATQPVLTFYGLSQAGRAVAAAASQADGGWQLQGHGIHARQETLCGPLPDIEIYPDSGSSRGSFVRLSKLLDSPLWGKASGVTLGDLWDCLPRNMLFPITSDRVSRRTPLYVDHQAVYGNPHPLVSVPVAYFPPWVISATDGYKALTEYLAAFPDAQGYDSYHRKSPPPNAIPNFTAHDNGWGELVMNWSVLGGQDATVAERLNFLEARTRKHYGNWYFSPALAASSRGIHPLMAWWAVLYTLSMLARYQPAEWSEHIDVNHSPHAVPIEGLLRDAISTVPSLVAEAVDQVVQSAGSDTHAAPHVTT